jgi:ATP-dependent DNA helicase RecQ
VSATGSGKSLCFQIPILLSRGLGVIISPLKALMSQQVADLQLKKIPSTFINGDLAPSEKTIRYQLMKDEAVKFVYCTPERFDARTVRTVEAEEIGRVRPSFMVVDEAHCIDRWGNDFRPNYSRLGAVRQTLGSPPVLAFTATAGVKSQKRILESLGIPSARVVVTGVNRPNIAFARLQSLTETERFELIVELLRVMPAGRAMLFVPTVKTGELLRSGLAALGLDVPFYHSKLGSANDREVLLGRFLGRILPPANVVICTNAFGMGLDVPDVRLVVHWHHPMSMEDYLQEFGRAGRDGNPSVAVLFTSHTDVRLLRFMAERSASGADLFAKDQALEAKYEAIQEMHENAVSRNGCFRKAIIHYFGDETPRRGRPLSIRIVDWLFSTSSRVKGFSHCCDVCDRVYPQSVVAWAKQVFSEASPSRKK